LANSGQTKQVPGTTNTVRIDNPHVPGQQEHAHIYDKNGNPIGVVNKDGTSSHGTNLDKLPKNKKILDYLRLKGFLLGLLGDVVMALDLAKQTACLECAQSGDGIACAACQAFSDENQSCPIY
jgi:hypothetical protein